MPEQPPSTPSRASDPPHPPTAAPTVWAAAAGLAGLRVLAHDALLQVPAVAWAPVGTVHHLHAWWAALLCGGHMLA